MKNAQLTRLPICCWAAEDIPSVKAERIGYNGLSTAELLSIIIGSGTMSENAIDLSRRLLSENNNSLRRIRKQRKQDLTSIYGIGDAKASKILAALELAARMNIERAEERSVISTATDVYNHMQPRIGMLEIEEFWALYLNQNHQLIQVRRISVGGISETAVDVRIILREAVLCNATILVVCHNHPSGSLRPSKTDNDLTKCIQNACQVMRILFQDHVVITENAYYSYKEEGKI